MKQPKRFVPMIFRLQYRTDLPISFPNRIQRSLKLATIPEKAMPRPIQSAHNLNQIPGLSISGAVKGWHGTYIYDGDLNRKIT